MIAQCCTCSCASQALAPFPTGSDTTRPPHSPRFYSQPTVPKMLEYFVAVVGLYLGYSFVCLELNYRRASAMGIPLVRVPVDPLNIPFQVLEPHLFKLLDLLPPDALPTFVRYLRRGWFFIDKADSHLRYGPIFACFTPRGIHVQVCDSEAIHDIFSRRLDFIRPSENYSEARIACVVQFEETNIIQSFSKYTVLVSQQPTWKTGHDTGESSLRPLTKVS